MYALKNYVLPKCVKNAVHRNVASSGGFTSDPDYCWAACDGHLYVWQAQQGSSATVETLKLPVKHVKEVSVFPSAKGGTLTIAACSECGQLLSWLDATANAVPFVAKLSSRDSKVSTFTATSYTGADSPGFLAAVSLIDGELVFVSVSLKGFITASNKAEATPVKAQTTFMKAVGGAIVGQYGGFGELLNLTGQRRSHSSKSPAVRMQLAHHEGVQWMSLVLAPDAMDCWLLTFTNDSTIKMQCLWSMSTAAAIYQRVPHVQSFALGFTMQGAHLCILQAIHRGQDSQSKYQLCVSFHTLPTVDALGLWGSAPECTGACALDVYVPTPPPALPLGSHAWQLTMQPGAQLATTQDIQPSNSGGPYVSTTSASMDGDASSEDSTVRNALLMLEGAHFSGHSRSGSETRKGLLAWDKQGVRAVLPDVSDALDVRWHAQEGRWQVLSPIFGVLTLQESGVGSAQQHLSVIPLLDAAISRSLAGCPLPGLAAALKDANALSQHGDQQNPVETFSQHLADTLQKDVASNAAVSLGAALQRKQQLHNALLGCLKNANLLIAGRPVMSSDEDEHCALPGIVVHEIFEHSERLSAMASLRSCTSTAVDPSADKSKSTLLQVAQAVYESGREISSESERVDLSAEAWTYSCPTQTAEQTLKGIAEISPKLQNLTQAHDMFTLLTALLHGAAAAQRSLFSRFNNDYRHGTNMYGPGWSARQPARAACACLLRQCLNLLPAGTVVRGAWCTSVLELAGLTVDRYAAAINVMTHRGEITANLLTEVQSLVSDVLARLHPAMAVMTHDASERNMLRTQLQNLAGHRILQGQTAEEHRIVSPQWLLKLLDEEAEEAHQRTASSQPVTAYESSTSTRSERLLAHLPAFHTGASLTPKVSVSPEEMGIMNRVYTHMSQNVDFQHYVMSTYAKTGRVTELLLLPRLFHPALQAFLQNNALHEIATLLTIVTNDPDGAIRALDRLHNQSPAQKAPLLMPGFPPCQVQRRAAHLQKAAIMLDRKRHVQAMSMHAGLTAEWQLREYMCDEIIAASDLFGAVHKFASLPDNLLLRRYEVLLEAATKLDDSVDADVRALALLRAANLVAVVTRGEPGWLDQHIDGLWADMWMAIMRLDAPSFAAAAAHDTQDEFYGSCSETILFQVVSICNSGGQETIMGRAAGSKALNVACIAAQDAVSQMEEEAQNNESGVGYRPLVDAGDMVEAVFHLACRQGQDISQVTSVATKL